MDLDGDGDLAWVEDATTAAAARVRQFPRHSGPGLSGGRFEHWQCLHGNAAGTQALAVVLGLILEARAPPVVLDVLLAGRLIALRKEAGGIRPLACGEALRRMAARAAVDAHRDALTAAGGPRQFGVGRRSGTELLHRAVSASLEAQPGSGVLSLDLSNAFNELDRGALRAAVAAKLPSLAPVVEAWYGRQSRHGLLRRHEDGSLCYDPLPAECGLDQARALSPGLFLRHRGGLLRIPRGGSTQG